MPRSRASGCAPWAVWAAPVWGTPRSRRSHGMNHLGAAAGRCRGLDEPLRELDCLRPREAALLGERPPRLEGEDVPQSGVEQASAAAAGAPAGGEDRRALRLVAAKPGEPRPDRLDERLVPDHVRVHRTCPL